MKERELEERGPKRHASTVDYDSKPQYHGYRKKELPQGFTSLVIYMNPDLHFEKFI